MAFQPHHRLTRQVLQRDVLLFRLQPAMGGEQLEFTLGDHLTMDIGMIGVVQAQAQIAFAQLQASDDLAGGLAQQAARRVGQASAQRRDALWQQLLRQGRCADDAQGRGLILLEAAGQALDRLERVIDMGDFHLQRPCLARGLQASTHAGKQHEAQLILGIAKNAFHLGHRQLQPFGGGAQVTGLQQRLDHFDMT